ncbi:MAG TPA: CBS domain-containing protein [Candidatus Polarisedimenticolaceae bacterium]|nr:CBS domain-containing protein [Candidatus Polarisedimenticolaceae bacterium]
MNQPPVTCTVHDNLNTAAGLMWEHDCGVVPVVDDRQLAGIITDRDICMAAFIQGKTLSEIPVVDIMSTEVCACHADETVEAAQRRMSEYQVRRMPVLDEDNRLIGVLSLNDIAREAAHAAEGEGVKRSLVQTLGAICQPRGPS